MNRKEKIKFVHKLLDFGKSELGLEFIGSFEKFSNKVKAVNWLYVVEKKALKSSLEDNRTFTFSWNRESLKRKENYYKKKQKDTYLYTAEAFGGAKCPIFQALLDAPRARQGYVVLHEAWHNTMAYEGIALPYNIEEAVGRLIGIEGAVLFAKKYKDTALLNEALEQKEAWLKFSQFINKTYKKLERFYKNSGKNRKSLFLEIKREADKIRMGINSVWEKEELTRTMNNAFFFRYYDYTKDYPLAIKLLQRTGSLKKAMNRVKMIGKRAVERDLHSFISA